jgi:hypothetical protein
LTVSDPALVLILLLLALHILGCLYYLATAMAQSRRWGHGYCKYCRHRWKIRLRGADGWNEYTCGCEGRSIFLTFDFEERG